MKQYTIDYQQKVLNLILKMDFFSSFSPEDIKTLSKYNSRLYPLIISL
ncbi:hypothetical protein PITCH_A1100017 [uncultured Desulfobacterium sp.]|uniref:Uncharacterized protein n=1 Tax=uncultured Desulfobacterium sp. TaxID=201089 RepID=A0A445MR36_9BACT|nr:hypothetical protein PITCH_A1100017 [uncultured Desulfobacterium sp.]